MRKRAQRRFKPTIEEPKHIVQQTKSSILKTERIKKQYWIPLTLIAIFFLVLFFNSYYNITSDVTINPDVEGLQKYYLSGPDPYYNMRLVEGTYTTGQYPYYSEADPLLNYPTGTRGGRAPLFNMMALGFSRLLTPFMDEVDAVGRSMQFIPALFGALLIFPVYYIGKTLFNKKAGLIGALLIAIIPIHISSGHGSAYSLFDHDSFNLLLFFLTFLFLILSIKQRDRIKSILYAVLGGVALAGLSMTWVEAQYLYVVIAVYAIVQMFFDIFTNKIDLKVVLTASTILWVGYLISFPVVFSKSGEFSIGTEIFLAIVVSAFGLFYYTLGRKKIPWTLSLPTIAILGGGGMLFLYFIKDISTSISVLAPLQKLSGVIFGSGIYGNKVSQTIAEASTYQISHSVMSFGPALYWLAWAGFILLMWYYYKNNQRRDYLFIVVLFIVNIWLAGTAGRFLNDMVPLIAILGGGIIWLIVEKIDYKQMIRNIHSAGGGIHGVRRGMKLLHVFGILFIAFIVILPNAFVAFDAAVPSAVYQTEDEEGKTVWTNLKWEMFGSQYTGAFGLGVVKEKYWGDAFNWFSQQDTDIENPAGRPAFISWWDYGFYEVALGGHPTVADNFQSGIPPAANFHTATSEKEAVIVWITRLIEGDKFYNGGKLSDDVKNVINKYLDKNDSADVIQWIETPATSPSYNAPIGAEYEENLSKDYYVGQQYSLNAVYQDVIDVLTNETRGLTDDELTWLYHDIQDVTGFSIRYYGVEGYDRQIFNIFAFLSDKSTLLVGAPEDDFVIMYYEGYRIYTNNGTKIPGSEQTWKAQEVIDMTDEEKSEIRVTGSSQQFKDSYFETMFYRTYMGPYDYDEETYQKIPLERGNLQIPCVNMKHFYAEFISDMARYQYYDTGKAAVVIAKYYEGAYINGTVKFMNASVDAQVVAVKNLTYTESEELSFDDVPIDHDKQLTDENGNYSVIAGAGSMIQVRRYDELGANAFVIKNVTFDRLNDTVLCPITDDDAMRRPDSNYERIINITIDPASIQGTAYNDTDDDKEYNESIDEQLEDISVVIREVTRIDINSGNPSSYNDPVSLSTNETGFYNLSELLPGIYEIIAYEDTFVINAGYSSLFQENTTFNIRKPKLSNIQGYAYVDDDDDGLYDSGEEILANAEVELNYKTVEDMTPIFVKSTTTDENGFYSFTSLIPSMGSTRYVVNITKDNDYIGGIETFPVENKTSYVNVSMEIAPVTVNGKTTYAGTGIDDVTIDFGYDYSVENNTAEAATVTTASDGTYTVDLKPGSYNISIDKWDGNTLVYKLLDQKLTLTQGEGTKDNVNFVLEKKSVAVSGTTTHDGETISEVNVRFERDETVENNTALNRVPKSDENGEYTDELTIGSYNITAVKDFTQDDKNYTYTWTGTLTVTESDIATGKTLNIPLEMIEKEETG
jgi:dolichyl-diphosphooligosaccharide--protein glycosyltransferase